MEPSEKKYLFICGCARSGTTITTDLLRSHSKIGIGRERYNSLFKSSKENFTPNLFNKQRFCKELSITDSHHTQLDAYYENLFLRWDENCYYGDKIPSLFKAYDYLMTTFSQPKIIFLLRNIIDVSESWENRRIDSINTNGKWPHERGWAEAIAEWNTSLNSTIKAISTYPNNIMIVPYEKLFLDKDLLKHIFNFLDIEITVEVENFWDMNYSKKKELDQNRIIKMSAEMKKQICLEADFDAYKTLLKLEINR